MEGACQGQVTARTRAHLTCVEYMCVVLGAHLVSVCCNWHICWLYACVVGLGAHLVLYTCWLYVEWSAWCPPGARGVALVKFQTFLPSLWDMNESCMN